METISDFKIIGISVRTTNQNNKSAADIGNLWGLFYAKNIAALIPNKISDDIYAIYTDYKSNYTEDYTTIIGIKVSSLDNIPAGLMGRQLGAENFLNFSAKGKMPQAVIDVWIDIWNRDSELNRNYSYDFEVYNEKSQNPENAEVDIFISVKEK